MSALALLTAFASAAAAGFFAHRAHLLKPECSTHTSAPVSVRAAVFLMAAIFAFHAQAVFFRQVASGTEAIISVGAALYAFVLWAHLYFADRGPAAQVHSLAR